MFSYIRPLIPIFSHLYNNKSLPTQSNAFYDKDSINTAVNDFTFILAYAGMKALKLKQHKCIKDLDQKIKYQWFDDECYVLRRILRIKGRNIFKKSLHRKECKKYINVT